MVKQRKKSNKKSCNGKGFKANGAGARKVDASTLFETCTEQLSPFGGLLALIKFFDLVGFKEIFNFCYIRPARDPKLGHYLMFVGILMLLFIGFNRLPNYKAKQPGQARQCALFEDDRYTYRIFCTNLSGPAHKIIATYDKRADLENLIGEAKDEGLDAIPSAKFKTNYAFFQIVMLAYNIWRHLKVLAQQGGGANKSAKADHRAQSLQGIVNNTIRFARLKLLFIAAKVVKQSNRHKVKYSIHDARTKPMLNFLYFLDTKRSKPRPWQVTNRWPQRFSLQTS
jgi:hypothetical protein